MSNYEIQKLFKDGKPLMRDDGKTQRSERVKLDEPKLVDAALFNGEQLRKLEKWVKPETGVSPIERAEAILQNSGVNIEHDGDEMSYHKGTDTIVIPEQEQFANHEQYLSEALHQLVHRELENQQETTEVGMVKPELRANIASLFLAKEIGLPFALNYHDGYANSWAQLLKDEPGELFKAAEDAQKIVNKVLGFEQQVQQQVETGQAIDSAQEQQPGAAERNEGTDVARVDATKLNKGEVIRYNGTEYKVVAELKNKVYQMYDVGKDRKFKMSSKDELFKSLLNARDNSQEIVNQHSTEINGHEMENDQGEEMEADFEIDNNQYYSR